PAGAVLDRRRGGSARYPGHTGQTPDRTDDRSQSDSGHGRICKLRRFGPASGFAALSGAAAKAYLATAAPAYGRKYTCRCHGARRAGPGRSGAVENAGVLMSGMESFTAKYRGCADI